LQNYGHFSIAIKNASFRMRSTKTFCIHGRGHLPQVTKWHSKWKTAKVRQLGTCRCI